MTDITDQDRRDAREWAEDVAETFKYDDEVPRETRAAVNYILATVDAPEPTLAEELRGWESIFRNEGRSVDANSMRTLASRADQMEHDLAEARAEVERLTAERQEETMRRMDEQYADLPVRDRDWLDKNGFPDPADVKPGEAWLVQVDGKAVAALRIGNGRWVTASGTGFYVWTHGVERLVSSLLPEVTA